ncbi:MAG: sigma-54-dependent transcriptional regulator [Myxococcota bacterium]
MESATHSSPSELPESPRAEDRVGRRRSDRIAGSSASTRSAVEQASLAARSDRPVLVAGPDGSGREHLARAIHAWSSRASGPLEVLRADSTPEGLHLRELFGASEGGDPLLDGGTEGLLGRAAAGTAIVAGAEKLSGAARDALLQCIRSGGFAREGESDTRPLTARVIVTADGAGADWTSQLSALEVQVQPLAERAEDVVPLAVHFLTLFAEEEGVEPVGFTADARRCLMDESWPGNVRELQERIRQAVRLSGGTAISVEALALSTDGDDVPSFKEAKRSFETRYVKGLLRRCGGNISRAARLAKKDRKDFYDVIRRTGVDPQEFRR